MTSPARSLRATWVLLSARPGFFEQPLIREAGTSLKHNPRLRPWTDDYSNLFQILQ